MTEINLKDLFHILLRKWWLLLICIAIFGSAATVWTVYYLTPIYEANTTLYVGKNADEQGLAAVDLNIGAAVILDYREIAKSRLVASAVIDELGFTNVSPAALSGIIDVSQKTNTRVIQITVRNSDPQMAVIIANKEAEVFQQKVVDIMQVENVQIIDKAELPTYPVSPNKRMNMMIGLILGLAIGVGITFLIEFLDNTVKTPEDIKKYVDLPVIGTIPEFRVKRKGA